MVITDDKYFNIRYNNKKDVLEMKKENKFISFVKANRFICMIVAVTTILVLINLFLIEKFYRIFVSFY